MHEAEPSPFVDWLKSNRKAKGWSVNRLADEVGTNAGVISQLEAGKRNASAARISEIAVALGVDPAPGLIAAGFMPNSVPEIERIAFDDDLRDIVGLYDGLTPENRDLARRMMRQLQTSPEHTPTPEEAAQIEQNLHTPVPIQPRRKYGGRKR